MNYHQLFDGQQFIYNNVVYTKYIDLKHPKIPFARKEDGSIIIFNVLNKISLK